MEQLSSEDEAKRLKELVDDSTEGETTMSNGSGTDGSLVKHSMDMEKTARRSIIVAILVFLVGAIASSAFLYVGISNEKASKADSFEKRSANSAKDLQGKQLQVDVLV